MSIAIQVIFFLLLAVFFTFFVAQLYNLIFRGFAPAISSRPKVVAKLVEKINARDINKVYELGCGNAGFLHKLRIKLPNAELVGYEYAFLPYFLSQIQNSFRKTKLKLRKKNFMKADLSDADLIYCYLNSKTMASLEKKFKQECRPGTMVISYQHRLPNLQPAETMDFERRGEKAYIYRM
jgi:hypothetical protein